MAFLDPPKDSAAPALAALRANGIQVKVLTWAITRWSTGRVCREVDLAVAARCRVAMLPRWTRASSPAVETTTVFAAVTLDKESAGWCALRANGHVVGQGRRQRRPGPARADIGVSVDSAVDIAREAADIILLEKGLLVLADGVREGRKTFANMQKYIRMTASSNFGNVFSMLVASVFALSPDVADAPAAAEPALRHLPDGHPLRQRG